MDIKSAHLKNENKSELFNLLADAQKSANGTTINAFEVRLLIHLRLHLSCTWGTTYGCTWGYSRPEAVAQEFF